jgi:ribonuclease BN (tRNA processing enzyme)
MRLEHVFVSHANIDHFFGFDRLVARGRSAFMDRKASWTMCATKFTPIAGTLSIAMFRTLSFVMTDIDCSLATRSGRLRLKNASAADDNAAHPVRDTALATTDSRTAVQHTTSRAPCATGC